MTNNYTIRWGWLKAMYIYTIVLAGGLGLGIIMIPNKVISIFGWPNQDPIMYGIAGSLYVSFGLLAILGLRDPLKFVPVLLLQIGYKIVWFIGVLIPMVLAGTFPAYGIPTIFIFASYIIGDLIAIPFPYVFARSTEH